MTPGGGPLPLAAQAATVAAVASAAGLGRHSLTSEADGVLGGGLDSFRLQPAVVRQRHLQPVVLLSARGLAGHAVRVVPGKGDAEALTEVCACVCACERV